MKLRIILLVIISGFLSCSNDSEDESITVQDFSIQEFPQRWDLFKMSVGMLANSEITGEDMEYQEYYIFN